MGYFSRVKKIEVKGKEEKEAEVAASKKGGGKKKEKEAGNASPRAKDTDRDEEGKRKKKKYRLQPHDHQKFVDSNEDVSYITVIYIGHIVCNNFESGILLIHFHNEISVLQDRCC